MRSVRWIIVTVVAVVGLALVAIAFGTLWLNSFIHSPTFKAEVETRASQSVGAPVTIESVDFDVLHGVKLQGLKTEIVSDPHSSSSPATVKLQVARVSCAYSLIDLLSFRLRMTGVTLDQPEITLQKLNAPAQPGNPPASGNTSAGAASSGGAGSSSPFQFVLDHAGISDGTLIVKDATGATTAQMNGIAATADTSGFFGGGEVKGKLKITQITASNLLITDFETPVSYRSGAVNADPLSGTAYSGKLAGAYQLDNAGPSTLTFNGKSIDMATLTAAAVSGSSAKLSGTLDLQSKWRGIESGVFEGEGDAQLTGGKLAGLRALEEAGNLLGINELAQPIITKAQTHFVVHDRVTKFIGLQVDSPVFKMTGNGSVAFAGQIDADLVLILSRDIMNRIPSLARGSFVQQPDGTGSISFHVSGTTSNPSTNLAERLLMNNLKGKDVLNKALNKFFK